MSELSKSERGTMKVIAVTGGIGSGKSTVSKEFGRLGARVLSADEIAHDNMQRDGMAYDEIVRAFGRAIVGADGEIERARLAEIVFSDDDKLELLNSVTHRRVYDVIKREIAASRADGTSLVCVEIPLLFSAECPLDIDLSIAVVADVNIRIRRVMVRDNCSAHQAELRIAKQISDERLRELADITIENNGDLNDLCQKVKAIFDNLCSGG